MDSFFAPDTWPNRPDGIVEGNRHFYAVRVYYEDTDLSGITYHANYLRWFERARSDLLRQLGIDQRKAIEQGDGAYAVADVALKYLIPARLDDDLLIETRCTQLGAASCHMEQTVWRAETACCHARLRVGFLALDGRPKRQPAMWREAFLQFINGHQHKVCPNT